MKGIVNLKLSVDLNKVKRGAPVQLFYTKIIGLAAMPDMGSVVIADGGATIPVEETIDEIKALIEEAKKEEA